MGTDQNFVKTKKLKMERAKKTWKKTPDKTFLVHFPKLKKKEFAQSVDRGVQKVMAFSMRKNILNNMILLKPTNLSSDILLESDGNST